MMNYELKRQSACREERKTGNNYTGKTTVKKPNRKLMVVVKEQ